jgi:hypothetical protein
MPYEGGIWVLGCRAESVLDGQRGDVVEQGVVRGADASTEIRVRRAAPAAASELAGEEEKPVGIDAHAAAPALV